MTETEFAHRAAGILHNMSLERKGFWRQLWRRWHMNDEPLRHDAANLLRESGFEFFLMPNGCQMVGDDQDYLNS